MEKRWIFQKFIYILSFQKSNTCPIKLYETSKFFKKKKNETCQFPIFSTNFEFGAKLYHSNSKVSNILLSIINSILFWKLRVQANSGVQSINNVFHIVNKVESVFDFQCILNFIDNVEYVVYALYSRIGENYKARKFQQLSLQKFIFSDSALFSSLNENLVPLQSKIHSFAMEIFLLYFGKGKF